MSIGIPCNACTNGFCGNCVADKLEVAGFIQDAKFHCVCTKNNHTNHNTKTNKNKNMFSSKRDVEPVHTRDIQSDTDDDFTDDE